MGSFKKLSIVIPVYNEEKFIAEIISRVFQADSLNLTKEVIIVDDGSRDKTAKILRELSKKYHTKKKTLKIISQKKNQGKGAALKAGFLATTGDIVLVQDADLEYDPVDYPLLLEPFLKREADAVYGSRLISNRPHRVLYYWHYVVNVYLTALSNMLTNLNLTDMETGYKVFRGDLIRDIAPKLVSKKFGFEPEITARIARVPEIKIYEVSISYFGRTYAEGKKIRARDGAKALWEIFRFNLFTR